MSLARAHRQRTEAARESRAAATAAPAPAGTLAGRIAAMLALHQATLKTIQSRAAKIEAKRGMLPEYAAYVDGVLAADAGAPDDILARIMLWRLDVGDWDGALAIAGYGIRHGLQMPGGFTRDLPTTVLEEIADQALAQTPPTADFAAPLDLALELTGESDMPDEVRAKAHKALGRIYARSEGRAERERAVTHLEAALGLHAGCGVKTKLDRLRKALDAGS